MQAMNAHISVHERGVDDRRRVRRRDRVRIGTVVGPDVGGSDVVGIYRVNGPDSFTVVADIGAFALSNPPGFPIDIPTGVQYALETYRGWFLVTDGHHNRVYRSRATATSPS
jgi:hypothetical protein